MEDFSDDFRKDVAGIGYINSSINHWDRMFWAFFVVAGLMLFIAAITTSALFEVLAGIVVIALGIHKLGEDFHNRRLKSKYMKIQDDLNYISHLLDSSQYLSKLIKQEHDSRFLSMESKRVEMDRRLRQSAGETMKQMNDFEKRLFGKRSELNRTMVTGYRELSRNMQRLEKRVDSLHTRIEKLK